MRPRGHIPDHPAVVARRVGIHLHPEIGAMRAGTLPMDTHSRYLLDPSKGGPGILDQHDTSTCEGHAHALIATLVRMILSGASCKLVSPVALILAAYLVDQRIDGSTSPLVDQGTMPSSIDAAWRLYGASAFDVWGQYPASSSTMYLHPEVQDPNDARYAQLVEPPVDKLFVERDTRYVGMFFVQSAGLQRVLDVLTLLAAKKMLTTAIAASGEQFQSYRGGVLTAAQMTGPIDHANALLDYAYLGSQDEWDKLVAALRSGDAITVATLISKLVFFGVNSWGQETWGEADAPGVSGGMYRTDASFVQAADDLSVVEQKLLVAA